jgi:phosphate starvation-inducible PhoH-like protein
MRGQNKHTSDHELGEEPSSRRGRRSRKQNEKEILREHMIETIDKDTIIQKQRQLYENLQYLSEKEKKEFEAKFTTPRNDGQKYYARLLKQKSKKIVVATGPAGTGKTLLATEQGIRMFLSGAYDKLIFTRPSVSVDEDLGFLPGTLEEKMAPWIRPIYDVLYNFISPKEVTVLLEEKVIEIAPLGYMRGRTFKNCWIVADEMQNSTISQMKMLMTRLGENSKLVVTGDLDQYDRANDINGLDDFLDKFRGKRSSSISSVEFQNNDIQREEVVKEVLDIYAGDVPPAYSDVSEENSECGKEREEKEDEDEEEEEDLTDSK